MAKVYYIDPVDHISGKVCRHTKTIFMHRRDSGTNFTSRICNPYTGAPSDAQQAANDAFKAAAAKAKAVFMDADKLQESVKRFKNQTKYKTLRGFIFADNYGKE